MEELNIRIKELEKKNVILASSVKILVGQFFNWKKISKKLNELCKDDENNNWNKWNTKDAVIQPGCGWGHNWDWNWICGECSSCSSCSSCEELIRYYHKRYIKYKPLLDL